MCGIAGIVSLAGPAPVSEPTLRQMLALIRHRGPDEFGMYVDDFAGLGSTRLAIVDLAGGQQPIANEDETLWVVFNGEIFNHPELRVELEARGHRFRTHSDTEVLVHAFEEYGPAGLHRLNGQFAYALWDTRRRRLFLARDRLGVRPLFYMRVGDHLLFGSEIKTLLADPRVRAELDLVALGQVFTCWSAQSPRSLFRGVNELPPGHFLWAGPDGMKLERYWQVEFDAEDHRPSTPRDEAAALEEFRALMVDAARLRLRADVPVGAYLSGGLDSSAIAAMVRRETPAALETFSISFSDPDFDESPHQLAMARHLGTRHHVVKATHEEIGRVFPQVIWHTETPLLRTSPAPLFLLSKLVHDHGLKVVLTGEGADEFLAGYDIFKEAQVRRFWARRPGSAARPELLRRLYPDIPAFSSVGGAFLKAFFGEGLAEVDAADYSHRLRWRTTRRTQRFFSEAQTAAMLDANGAAAVPGALPEGFGVWHPLHRAQYLEITTFLSPYLLSSQGDRVAMAHAVEGRFPFLDHRVVEFCNRLPPGFKLRGLQDKRLLRQLGREWLPAETSARRKRPFRAPIHRSFFGAGGHEYVRELLSPTALRRTGLFKPAAVAQLAAKCERGQPLGETDDMALVGILSTQLWVNRFIEDFRPPPPLTEDEVRVVRRGASERQPA